LTTTSLSKGATRSFYHCQILRINMVMIGGGYYYYFAAIECWVY